MRLPDSVWEVIKDHLLKYEGFSASDEIRRIIEENTNIQLFDGGAFISKDNEFDLFVIPEKRGNWKIRSTINKYLDEMGTIHGKIVVRIDDRNNASLRLARHFGFHEVSRDNGVIRLEKDHGRYN